MAILQQLARGLLLIYPLHFMAALSSAQLLSEPERTPMKSVVAVGEQEGHAGAKPEASTDLTNSLTSTNMAGSAR